MSFGRTLKRFGLVVQLFDIVGFGRETQAASPRRSLASQIRRDSLRFMENLFLCPVSAGYDGRVSRQTVNTVSYFQETECQVGHST